MATQVKEEPKEVMPKRATVFLPSVYGNLDHPIEHFTEGQGSCKKIRNETFSQPRLVIEFNDNTERQYIGLPFIIDHELEADKPKPKETRL